MWNFIRVGAVMVLALGLLVLAGCTQSGDGKPILAHERFGTGPDKVLVLHDWLGDRHNFDPVRPYLDDRAFTYVFADLRGYGGSQGLSGTFTEDEAAADVLRLADFLGWDRFHIVGHSMTGMVVQRVAANAPDRVVSIFATTPVSAAGLQSDEKTRAFLEGAAVDPTVTGQMIQALTGKRLSESWTRFKVKRTMASSTKAARLGYLKMFDRSDFHQDVAGLDIPVTVFLGKNDLPFFQPPHIRDTFGKWYDKLTIVVSPNAGHYPMQETPAFYASALDRHLRENAGR